MATIVYITAGTVTELTGHGDTALDGMIEAQDDLGQIAWDALSHAVAVGNILNPGERAKAVAVFNLDLADGMDVIRVTNWVNHGGDLGYIVTLRNLEETRMRTVNDNHDTYSFLLDVSDFFRSLEDMGDWADRISAIADENFDPSACSPRQSATPFTPSCSARRPVSDDGSEVVVL